LTGESTFKREMGDEIDYKKDIGLERVEEEVKGE
jgi:hypothetical protein